MATVFCGVAVTVAQLGNIVTCAEHACHYQLVQWNAFDLQAVEIRPAYVLQQHCGTWHEIWYAAVELVYMIIRIAAHIHKFFHAVLRLCTVIHRRNSVASGSSHLHAVAVGKDSLKRTYTVNAALARCPVGIEKVAKAVDGCIPPPPHAGCPSRQPPDATLPRPPAHTGLTSVPPSPTALSAAVEAEASRRTSATPGKTHLTSASNTTTAKNP